MFENTNMAKIRGDWGCGRGLNYDMIKDYFEKDEVVGVMTKGDKGEQEWKRVVWKDVLRGN